MLTENSLKSHFYLYIAGIVLFILFLGYVFWYDHKTNIDEGDDFVKIFKKEGLSDDQISQIRHDDDVWYYKGKSTCIGYSSDSKEHCPYFQSVCTGKDSRTFGTIDEQIKEVAKIIKKGDDQHPDCPLIYEGAD